MEIRVVVFHHYHIGTHRVLTLERTRHISRVRLLPRSKDLRRILLMQVLRQRYRLTTACELLRMLHGEVHGTMSESTLSYEVMVLLIARR